MHVVNNGHGKEVLRFGLHWSGDSISSRDLDDNNKISSNGRWNYITISPEDLKKTGGRCLSTARHTGGAQLPSLKVARQDSRRVCTFKHVLPSLPA